MAGEKLAATMPQCVWQPISQQSIHQGVSFDINLGKMYAAVDVKDERVQTMLEEFGVDTAGKRQFRGFVSAESKIDFDPTNQSARILFGQMEEHNDVFRAVTYMGSVDTYERTNATVVESEGVPSAPLGDRISKTASGNFRHETSHAASYIMRGTQALQDERRLYEFRRAAARSLPAVVAGIGSSAVAAGLGVAIHANEQLEAYHAPGALVAGLGVIASVWLSGRRAIQQIRASRDSDETYLNRPDEVLARNRTKDFLESPDALPIVVVFTHEEKDIAQDYLAMQAAFAS